MMQVVMTNTCDSVTYDTHTHFQTTLQTVFWQCHIQHRYTDTVLYLRTRRSVLMCHHVLAATNWFCWHCTLSCSRSAIIPPK